MKRFLIKKWIGIVLTASVCAVPIFSYAVDDKTIDIGDSVYTAGDGLIFKEGTISVSNILGHGNDISASSSDYLEQPYIFGSGNTVVGSGLIYNYIFGSSNELNGESSLIVGSNNVVDSDNALTIGSNNYNASDNSVILGSHSRTSADNSIALGFKSLAEGNNSVAIGYESAVDIDDVVSFGHTTDDNDADGNDYTDNYYRRLINVDDGVNDHDVTTLGQVKALIASADSGTSYTAGNGIKISDTGKISVSDVIGIGKIGTGSYGSKAIGQYSYVTDNTSHSMAIGYGAIATEANTISFGHLVADSSKYSDLISSDGVSSEMNTLFSNDYLPRLVNVADGVNDHDVTTLGQVKSLISSIGSGSTYKVGTGLTVSDDNTLSISNVIGSNSSTPYSNSLIFGSNTTIAQETTAGDAGGQIAIGNNISISTANKAEVPRSSGSGESSTWHSIVIGDNSISGEERGFGHHCGYPLAKLM